MRLKKSFQFHERRINVCLFFKVALIRLYKDSLIINFLRVAIITFACSVRPSLRLLHSIMATLLLPPFSLRQFLDYSVN